MAGGAQQQAASAEQSMIGGIGEAIGGIGSFALAGGFGKGGPFAGNQTPAVANNTLSFDISSATQAASLPGVVT